MRPPEIMIAITILPRSSKFFYHLPNKKTASKKFEAAVDS